MSLASNDARFLASVSKLYASVVKGGKLKVLMEKPSTKRGIFGSLSPWKNRFVFVDNMHLIITEKDPTQEEERAEDRGHRREISLKDIETVVPLGDSSSGSREQMQFKIVYRRPRTASEDATQQESAELHSGVRTGMDNAMAGRDRQESHDSFSFDIQSSVPKETTQEEQIIFRARDAVEAGSWVNAINRAIQVHSSGVSNSVPGMLREYSAVQGDVDRWTGGKARKSLGSRKKDSLTRGGIAEVRPTKTLTRLPLLHLDGPNKERSLPTHKYAAWGRDYVGDEGVAKIRRVFTVIITLILVQAGVTCFIVMTLFNVRTIQRQQVIAFLEAAWFGAFVWINDQVRLHVTPDSELPTSDYRYPQERQKIIICNHSSQVDAVYIWMLSRLTRRDRSGYVKMLAKKEVAKIPILGTALELVGFPYLSDNWQEDRKRIHKTMRYFTRTRFPVWVVVFPEGVTVNQQSVDRSHRMTKNTINVRPEMSLAILPRSREFEAVLESLEKYDPEIFDFTMQFDSYSGEVPSMENRYERETDYNIPTLAKLMDGTASKNVYMDVRKFSVENIRGHAGGVSGWLDARWARKERFLQHFLEHRSFPVEGENTANKVIKITGSLDKFSVVAAAWAVVTVTTLAVIGGVLVIISK